MTRAQFIQEPVAVVGFACRLPGGNHSPQKLWDFLERGGIASNKVPKSRFNIDGHYDGSHKPGTMRPPGGMFIDVDLAAFDASFFEIGGSEAIAMDPNQRQMLEVVVEALENAGLTLEQLNGAPVACYVGSYASDYGDMQNRDAEDRPANCAIGVGRAIMANRLSYFLNIKGPSITLDTACSGSLVGLDLACRSVQSGEVDAAIIATSNFYLNPDHVMDAGNVGQAHSPSGLCHTFDIDADGYVKAEAVSCVIVKRLSTAIQHRDPIRAIVRGTASNSNGRTNGIASPSPEAQAAAIRQAYMNAGIADFNETAYLECHGTGTQAGDPVEVKGLGSVFAPSRSAEQPLLIGSIKSNVGHSEPAAGNSGLMKVIMSMEKGVIPGTPLFIKPNPKIDFQGFKVKASRTAIPWPDEGFPLRRASVNSFGYGGSNAHAIVEQPDAHARSFYVSSYKSEDMDDDLFDDEELSERPYTLVVSANDSHSLKKQIQALSIHLANPRVKVNLEDLAYTLSERRTRHWHRAYLTTRTTDITEHDFTIGKNIGQTPKIALVFTGQGAQWPQMGKELLQFFPWTQDILEELDRVLQAQADPPSWSLIAELTEPRTAEHMRQPEFAQPLVTALQLCILAVLESWGVRASSVVGHSSGEIAAAYAAGLLDRAGAIKAAFYRGRAAINRKHDAEADVGMLAVGLGPDAVAPFVEKYAGSAWIACFNSPSSLTISGRKPALEALAADITAAGHFARLLQVDLAYHSELMGVIGEEYETLLSADQEFCPKEPSPSGCATMFSSVTGTKKETAADALYWKTNMVSHVRFAEAFSELVAKDSPNLVIEVGPSGALAGPVSQILKSLPSGGDTQYCASWSRGANSGKSVFDTAGRLFSIGFDINMSTVNNIDSETAHTIIDLPNYCWNHTVKYWHENAASRDWRNKEFITHDLLGSKIPGTTWQAPTWRKHLNLADVPWLRDHKMGPDVLVPGAGLATLALEAMYQKYRATHPDENISSPNELAYRFRNVKFDRAVVVEEGKPTTIMLTLSAVPGSADWHAFHIRTTADGVIYEHCGGLIRVQDPIDDSEEALKAGDLKPLQHPQSAKLWYKVQREVGMDFGPSFQTIKSIESVSGSRKCRALVSMEPPASKWNPQSYYPVHPAVLDGCLQTATPANAAGERSLVKDTMIPALVDDMVINKMPKDIAEAMSVAESIYTGRGREDVAKSWIANITIRDPQTGGMLIRVRGLNYIRLDVDQKPDPHVLHAVTWKPDVTLLTLDQFAYLTPISEGSPKLHTVIDLIAQKIPALKVLEINLDDRDTSTLWFGGGDDSARAAYTSYHFATRGSKSLVSVQGANDSKRNATFSLIATEPGSLGLPTTESTYDLAIVKVSAGAVTSVEEDLKAVKPLLTPNAFMLLVESDGTPSAKPTLGLEDQSRSLELDSTPSESSGSGSRSPSSVDTPVTIHTPSMMDAKDPMEKLWKAHKLQRLAHPISRIFSSVKEIPRLHFDNCSTYLCRNSPSDAEIVGDCHITVARFHADAPALPENLRVVLKSSGWKIDTQSIEKLAAAKPHHAKTSVVLVLDELFKPVMTEISEDKWDALKRVISTGQPLLWVTKGSQTAQTTNPDNAMVHGLFRVVRREDPQAQLTTLDVQSATSISTAWAVDQVLRKIRSGVGAEEASDLETEYAERDGIIYLQRIKPDAGVNAFRAAENGSKGLEPVVRGLHEAEAQVRIQAEKIGTLQSLTWCETATTEIPVAPGMVEIEVQAVGVNFKDVATTMGIVPENEYTIGCECAGYIKRIAPGLNTSLKVGDRVAAMRSGTYANRVQCPHERVHVIPDTMSYEDAATIPLVYLTAIYSLYHLGNLREGQSVLIHSASGGVGIAAIQLAQYKKCDVFVTVGTDEKREFLARNFGIPYNRMFSSRNMKFAEEIRRETNGRGVDVILNSLIGELLDESWRLTADGGIMVEIGKRDIVDRHTLAMEPFDRNCSFRAVDLSYVKEISNELIGRLMREIFDLVNGGHVGPVHPVTIYGADEVIEALSYIRRGQHIGKVVVSLSDEKDVQVPIRPAIRKLQLDPEAAYLIVGGLKGLCGSVAVHMARHGARHIIAMSRSGIQDDASARVIANCAAYGCKVTDAKGDVGDLSFVRQVFKGTRPTRIAGVIQGAMVLRDKPYEMMTHDDYHAPVYAKVVGTWNLHHAALQEQKQPLDFFTMLSSISGVVGNKGQANYAAANAFLDAFASYRLQQGLSANTVDLGAIEDVGYIAEQGGGLEARFDKRQWTPINEGVLRQFVTYSVFQQTGTPLNALSRAQLITGLALTAGATDLAQDARFSYLLGGHASGNSADDDDGSGAADDQTAQAVREFGVLRASGAEPAALAKAALGPLLGQISKILRLETEMEPEKPIMAYGLDSLSAVELRGWVRQKLGAELSTLDIMNASSLVALSEKLVSKLPVEKK
ncbi:putative polyketide synthase [Biscogniauxia mediterranea]|nr:putative polyketide synthase [Biscogniauxia mediterranea]